jgi:hypothetical protein
MFKNMTDKSVNFDKMINSTPPMQLQEEDDLAGLRPSFGGQMPINEDTLLRNKIISSDNKENTISIKRPKFSKVKIALPQLDNNKKIIYISDNEGNLVPVIRKIVTLNYLEGFDELEVTFPIKNWHSDSTTSAFLQPDEVRFVRLVDDCASSLLIESLMKPGIDHTHTFYRLYNMKSSVVDTSKGRAGQAVEKAITTVTRSEGSAWDYQKEQKIADFEARQKKGFFGWGGVLGFL